MDYVDENGEKSTGIAAASALREAKNEWAGYITDDVLRKVLEENALIINSEEYLSTDVIENEKAYSKRQGFSDIREMINRAFGGFQDYNYYRADSVTQEEISSFYSRRTDNLIAWLNSDEQENRYSEQEQQFLIAQYEKLETPFYYEYADGWEALLEYAPSIIMLVILITGFLVSGYSQMKSAKSGFYFLFYQLGRNKAIAAKISGFYCSFMYLLDNDSAVFGNCISSVGNRGADCAIQNGFSYWKSFITYISARLSVDSFGWVFRKLVYPVSVHACVCKNTLKALAVTILLFYLFIPHSLSEFLFLSEVLDFFQTSYCKYVPQ